MGRCVFKLAFLLAHCEWIKTNQTFTFSPDSDSDSDSDSGQVSKHLTEKVNASGLC